MVLGYHTTIVHGHSDEQGRGMANTEATSAGSSMLEQSNLNLEEVYVHVKSICTFDLLPRGQNINEVLYSSPWPQDDSN